jgi:hypothetical protein
MRWLLSPLEALSTRALEGSSNWFHFIIRALETRSIRFSSSFFIIELYHFYTGESSVDDGESPYALFVRLKKKESTRRKL